jgi:hypothetical protein
MASTISAGTTSGTALNMAGDTSGILQLQTNGTTTALTINTAQGVQALNCISVGNATPSTSGAGITFPATQSASSDANTLDDYEEGTWTPTLSGSTGTIGSQAYSVQEGRYVKIGRFVLLTGYLTLSNKGSWTGSVRIAGFPFTINNAANSYSAHMFYAINVTLPALNYGFGAYCDIGTTYAGAITSNSNGIGALSDYAGTISNSSQIGPFQICYYASA